MPMQNEYSELIPLLTVQDAKIQAYRSDFVSEEAWDILCRVWGDRVGEFVYGHSFVLIKPEALARRCSQSVLLFLQKKRLVPVAVTPVSVDRNAAHLIWRFQWNAATVDRVRLTNMVNAQSDSILVMVRDADHGVVPASVKLWGMKGSAHADRRNEQHLRTLLRMHNRMLGFVHTPDEPADLVRDLSILLGGPALVALVRDCAAAPARSAVDLAASVCAEVLRTEAASRKNEIDPARSMARLQDALGRRSPGLRALADAMQSNTKLPLDAVLEAVDGGLAQPWDVLTIASEVIRHDRPGVKPLIDARAVGEVTSRWAEHGAVLKNALDESIHAF
ncbi:nucleoside-diphosphate kinase [Paracidovorax cattleyae]|nr:nucleoside-diphosphate kinase [Paracidovorax cattleyae]AVS73629.1 hypothetical protein C8240_05780 [Paracidovorax cattleyae]MBF9264718.1 hypothetical protein [Paracidovorax cattleyae]